MTARTTHAQFSAMVEFMEKNGDLSKSHNLPQGRFWGSGKWKELSDMLNNLGSQELTPSIPRSEDKWRKVWSDLKNNTKRKVAKMKKLENINGGSLTRVGLTNLERRVMLLCSQKNNKIPLPEGGFDLTEESTAEDKSNSVSAELLGDNVIIIKLPDLPIVGDEDWNIPGSSKNPEPTSPIHGSTPPPESTIPKSASPPASPIALNNEISPHSPSPKQQKRTLSEILEKCANECDQNIKYEKSDDELSFLNLERERIRQRDIELRQRNMELLLQAHWLELMKSGLNMLDRYLNGK